MANDFMQVGPPDLGVGYGNAGSASFYGLQQELLKRAALARQAQLDDEQRRKDALAAEVAHENIASSKVQREAQAQLNSEKANAIAEKRFELTHGVGSDLSPEDKAVALRLYGNSAVSESPAQAGKTIPGQPAQDAIDAQPAVIGVPDENGEGAGRPAVEAQAAKPAVDEVMVAPKAAKTTFAGTEEQQSKKSAKDLAHSILNGDYDTGDNDTNQEFKGWALSTLMTGKATSLPAGVLHPKSQTEKDSTRYFNTRAAQKLNKPVDPQDAAFADAYEKIHPTEATKQMDRIEIQVKNIEAANTRQSNQFANASAEEAFKELEKDYKDLNTPRLVKLIKTLQSPGGVNDVVAVPEFLSSLAGGQGAGLRMSQAELNMIQNARPLLDSLVLKAGNIVGLNKGGYEALTAPQRAQMNALISQIAQHNYDLGQLYVDTQDRVTQARSAGEVRQIKADLARHELDLFGDAVGATKPAGGSGLPPGVTVTKHSTK